jgi:hypothetical protein
MRCPTTAAILKCPITGDDLEFADADTINELHADIVAKTLLHLDGSPVGTAFDAFLKSQKSQIYYPIRDNVFMLLSNFAIVNETERERYAAQLTPFATLALMRFYDQIGWKRTASGVFHDADINEDFRAVSRRYIHDCHLRVNDYLPPRGRYILDIASGPIQYDEYLTYSKNFAKRICCDVSFEALRAAASRIGDNGIFIQCDITNIPLKDGAVDGFVCLHTIYHVPGEKQILAFRELERVTRKGGAGVVVYSWADNSWGSKLAAPWRAIVAAPAQLRSALHPFVPEAVLRWRRRRRGFIVLDKAAPAARVQAASQHCFHAHSYRWYKQNVAASGNWSLRAWRSVGLKVLKEMVPNSAFGALLLGLLYHFENLCPALLGRVGQYPMFVFRKTAAQA